MNCSPQIIMKRQEIHLDNLLILMINNIIGHWSLEEYRRSLERYRFPSDSLKVKSKVFMLLVLPI